MKLCQEGVGNIKPLQHLHITLADGGIIHGEDMCEDVQWKMQGYEFSTNAIVIPLSSYDIILGMQWFRQ